MGIKHAILYWTFVRTIHSNNPYNIYKVGIQSMGILLEFSIKWNQTQLYIFCLYFGVLRWWDESYCRISSLTYYFKDSLQFLRCQSAELMIILMNNLMIELMNGIMLYSIIGCKRMKATIVYLNTAVYTMHPSHHNAPLVSVRIFHESPNCTSINRKRTEPNKKTCCVKQFGRLLTYEMKRST